MVIMNQNMYHGEKVEQDLDGRYGNYLNKSVLRKVFSK